MKTLILGFLLLTASISAEIVLSRDSYGIPSITSDIAKSIGYAQAEDRLWQIFFNVQIANGRGAEHFGAALLDSDILQHQLNYTDIEVQAQFDTYFTERAKIFYEDFVSGLNAYVATVNQTPSLIPYEFRSLGMKKIPLFSLYDILRTNQFILQHFSPSSIPSYQLTNLTDLEILISKFGVATALEIFNDIDPTTSQVKSPYTIVASDAKTEKEVGLKQTPMIPVEDAASMAEKLEAIKALHNKTGVPSSGSNGQAISAAKSASGNPMIRIAPQPNYNHPSDFYQIRIEDDQTGLRGNYFTIPTFPFTPNGVFNNYGVGVQVGSLPSNDFLFESPKNAKHVRTDTIKVLNGTSIQLPIYRSISNGWVITHPILPETTKILTLRSAFMGKQLRALNAFIESAFAKSYTEFINTLLNPAWQSDILLLEGDYVDGENTISAFHTGGWTTLEDKYDRRIPQGALHNPVPDISDYKEQKPLLETNPAQGYYAGWNSLFKQETPGSSDIVLPVGLNRMYWIDQYIRSIPKLTYTDLKNVGLRQFGANCNTPFDDGEPDFDADLFAILFKEHFFQAVQKFPTENRLQAIALLKDFNGEWFDGDLITTLNVSDKKILACVWMNAVANKVLNPKLKGTSREVATATAKDPLPNLNTHGVHNTLIHQANTLSRIFNLAYDNTIFFKNWLKEPVDSIIVEALDFALDILGDRPWGKDKRGIHQFNNLILGSVQKMLMGNVSGCVLVAEFKPTEIYMESILALGESGQILGTDTPKINPHCFDQQPLFLQLKLRPNPSFNNSKESSK